MSQTQIVLASFASTSFARSLTELVREARESNWFSFIEVWTPERIVETDPVFGNWLVQFAARYPRGYGLWVWKPWLLDYLVNRKYKDAANTVVVYMDAGCKLNVNEQSVSTFTRYVDHAILYGVFTFELVHLERRFCKPSLLCKFAAPTRRRQLMATVVFICCTSSVAQTIVTRWKTLSLDNDAAMLLEEGFRNHRHDQAVWSLIVPRDDVYIHEDETYFGPSWDTPAARTAPIWSIRRRLR